MVWVGQLLQSPVGAEYLLELPQHNKEVRHLGVCRRAMLPEMSIAAPGSSARNKGYGAEPQIIGCPDLVYITDGQGQRRFRIPSL